MSLTQNSKLKTQNCKAILFDLDNTLIDRPRSLAVYAERFRDHWRDLLGPIELPDLVAALQTADHGGYRPKPAMFELLLAELPWRQEPSLESLLDHWYAVHPGCAQPMAGLWPTLTTLQARGLRFALVTNGWPKVQYPNLDQIGLRPLMDAIIVSEEVGLRKPDRRIFELALSRLGVAAAEAWFVGDHPLNDVLAAEAAGLTAVWLAGSHPWPADQPPPRYRIELLAELVDLVEKEQ